MIKLKPRESREALARKIALYFRPELTALENSANRSPADQRNLERLRACQRALNKR